MQRLFIHALVAEIQATLEANGQPFGTGAHLRIGELLQNLPENTAPEQLKTLLSPVLCTTKEEQEQFYQIFDRCWKQVEAVGIVETDEPPLHENETLKTRFASWALLALLLVLSGLWVVGYWNASHAENEIPIAEDYFGAFVGDPDQSIQIDSLVRNSRTLDGRKFQVESLTDFYAISDTGNAALRLDLQQNRIHHRNLEEGSDTVWLRAHPRGWHQTKVWRHRLIFDVYPPPDTTPEPEPLDTALYALRAIPHLRDTAELEVPQPTAREQFLHDWEWPLKLVGMLFAGLLVWMAARAWERKRRKLIAEHRPNHKPPYAWSIQLKNPPRIDLGERFHRLLNQLRRREAGDNWRLDVPKTVRATVAKGGMPQIRFARQTRPSEYLLLIDRHSPRNHQAQLFDYLSRAFRSQEVLLERFWYDGDPRLCWNEAFPGGLDPRSLHYHYPQSRVLVFGDGAQWLNQETGKISKWAVQTLSGWQDRALLTPRPMQAWGRREHALRDLFHVLPVSLSALEAAIERFESDAEKDIELDPRHFPDAAQAEIQLIDNDLIKTLYHYFSPAVAPLPAEDRQIGAKAGLPLWIAACAVYPELHWDMTLYLGELLSDGDTPLLSSDNIAQICRLPWFSEGEIPLEARKKLLAWLESEHPDTLHEIRAGIHRLLAQNPPPADSAAHDAYAMNMALNEWLHTKDSARKKELEQDIYRRVAAGQAADFMVLKLLDGPRSPEEFEVPENWRKHLRQKGLARTARKAWVWALPLWLLLCAGISLWKPEQPGCKGIVMNTMGKEWCAETLQEVLEVWEMQAINALENPEAPNMDTLVDATVRDILETGRDNGWMNQSARDWQNLVVDLTLKEHIDSNSFFQNLAVAFFNRGVLLRDTSLRRDALSCIYFLRAQELNALLPDTAQFWYVRMAAWACDKDILKNSLKNDDNSIANHDNKGQTSESVEILKAFEPRILESTRVSTGSKPFDNEKPFMEKEFLDSQNYEREINDLEIISNRNESQNRTYQKLNYYRGLQLYQSNQKIQSRRYFTKSLEYPLDKRIALLCSFWLGSIANETGEYSLSKQHLNVFLAAAKSYNTLPESSSFTTGQYIQGYNYLKTGDYKKALSLFTAVCDFLKRNRATNGSDRLAILGDATLRTADCYFKTNRFNDALAYYDESIKGKYEGFEYAIYQKAIIQGLKGNQVEKALTLEDFINNYPNSQFADDALYQLGNTYFEIVRFDQSISAFQRLIKDFRGKSDLVVPALLKLGLVSYNQGNYYRAIDYIKQVFANNPIESDAKDALSALWEVYSQDLNRPDEYYNFLETIPQYKKYDNSQRENRIAISDRDGDGVPDKEDRCPDEKGKSENKGCPGNSTTHADRDGDGVPDAEDSCPDQMGTTYGCPPGTLFKEYMVRQGETLRSIATKFGMEPSALALANGLEPRETLLPGKRLLIPMDKEGDRDGDGVPDGEDRCPELKGTKENGGCPEASNTELPQFPYPPARPSSSLTLSRSLFSKYQTLGDIEKRLANALDQKGYGQRSYFGVPNGFAVVTQMEQFDKEGNSLSGASRWVQYPSVQSESLWDYFKNLVLPAEGNFRVFVYIVTNQPFTFSSNPKENGTGSRSVDFNESTSWVSQGLNRLPSNISKIKFSESYEIIVLVYEYKVTESNKSASLRLPGLFPTITHLTKAGILDALRN